MRCLAVAVSAAAALRHAARTGLLRAEAVKTPLSARRASQSLASCPRTAPQMRRTVWSNAMIRADVAPAAFFGESRSATSVLSFGKMPSASARFNTTDKSCSVRKDMHVTYLGWVPPVDVVLA